MPRIDTPFSVVPNWLLAPRLVGARAIQLYATMWSMAGYERGAIEITRPQLAEQMGSSVDTVDRAMRELEAVEAVKVIREHPADAPHEYLLHLTPGGRKSAAPRTSKSASTRPPQSASTSLSDTRAKEVGTNVPTRRTASVRPKNVLWDAVAEVCGWNPDDITRAAQGQLAAAVRDIRAVDGTPDDVVARARNYLETYDRISLTPTALAKHWPSLGGSGPVMANGHKPQYGAKNREKARALRAAEQRAETHGLKGETE